MITILGNITVLPPLAVRTAGMIRPRGLGSGIPLAVGTLTLIFAVARRGKINLTAYVGLAFRSRVECP